MKLFILTHCTLEKNHTPKIYKTLEEAKKAIKQIHQYTDDHLIGSSVLELGLNNNDTELYISYFDKLGTYDIYEIFEVEA